MSRTETTQQAAAISVSQQPAQPLTLRQRLQSPQMIAELAKAMPSHCKPERMARIAITALTKTPKLQQCDPASFFRCLLDLSQWGLEPDGRRAHLIPYENRKEGIVECQLIIDYKGYVELAYRSGVVKSIHADVVRDGDLFVYNSGIVERHTPWFLRPHHDRPDSAGQVFAVYCRIELVGGAVKCEVMSVDEVEAIKENTSAWKAYKAKYIKTTPWESSWQEMAKKTVFRRASKWIPLSAEIADAFDRDDDRMEDIASSSHSYHRASTLDELRQAITGSLAHKQHEPLPVEESHAGDEATHDSDKPAKAGDQLFENTPQYT